MPDPVIHIQNVCKSYPTGEGGELHVLRGIDLDVSEGKVLAIVGSSGAGKSTLLHLMGALDRPTSGSVVMNGSDIFGLRDQELSTFRNKNMGFVFQFHHLLPEFTAIENVAMPALIAGESMSASMQRARSLLELVNVDHRGNARPSQLSGGEQQRVAVARALVNSPRLLLADEPSGNLDHENALSLHKILWSLAHDKGQTIVLVTHDLEVAASADVTVTLRDGKLVKS
jgi:lipoprotein-releasing system ATP-binding protein